MKHLQRGNIAKGIAIPTLALLAASTPLAWADALADVNSDLDLVRSEIKIAETQDTKYTGGLVKSLITARIAVLLQTEAMLRQKLASLKFGAPVVYTIDGKAFSPSASANQMLADVETELVASSAKIRQQEAEAARYSGGLTQAMALATLETMRQTFAMLEQKRVSLKYELPQYVGFNGTGNSGSPPVVSSAAEIVDGNRVDVGQPAPADELRRSLEFDVVEKGFIPADASSRRYQPLLTLRCWYANKSMKEIRAFTGTVIFQDLFGKEIYRLNVTISNPIKAGLQATWNGSAHYNQFVEAEQRFRATELQNMKVIWMPSSIIFGDGTRIGEGSKN